MGVCGTAVPTRKTVMWVWQYVVIRFLKNYFQCSLSLFFIYFNSKAIYQMTNAECTLHRHKILTYWAFILIYLPTPCLNIFGSVSFGFTNLAVLDFCFSSSIFAVFAALSLASYRIKSNLVINNRNKYWEIYFGNVNTSMTYRIVKY